MVMNHTVAVAVVPAKAGTHIPQLLDSAVAMGPGSRSLRSLGRDDSNSHRIPREHITRALERRERCRERALELLIEPLRRPSVGAMDRADRPRLIEQEHLIVAHREDLPADPLCAIG